MTDTLPATCLGHSIRKVLLSSAGGEVRAWSWEEGRTLLIRAGYGWVESGLLPGEVVLFSGPVHPGAWFAAWGVWLAGGRVAWVEDPADVPAAKEHLEAKACVGTAGEDPWGRIPSEELEEWVSEELQRRVGGTSPEETALILVPRGHGGLRADTFSHRGLLAAARSVVRHAGLSSRDRLLVGVPPDHPAAWGVMLAFLVSEASLILPSADPSSPFAAERLATVWLTPSTLPDRRVAMLEARMTGLGGSVALLSRLAQAQGQAAFRRRAGSLPTSLVQALALRAARQWLLDDLVEHLGPSLRLVLATGDRPLDRTTRIFQAAGVPLVRALASRRTAGLLSCESPWDADGGDLGELGEEWRHEVTDAGDLLIRGAGCLTGRVKDPRGYEALCFAGWTRAGMRVELEGRRVRAVRPEESPEEAPWPVTDWAAKLCEMGGVTGVTRLEGVGLFIEAPARTPGLNWWGGGAEPLTRGVPHPAVTRRLLDLLGTPDAEREVLAWHVLDRLPRTSLGALDTRTLRREFPLLSKGKP